MADRAELYECPEEYRLRFREVGGVNRYEEDNFRLVWGMGGSPDCFFRAGGIWEAPDQPTYRGYRDLLIGMNERCWILQQWYPPEYYGTPASYYLQNYDSSGYQTLGEYPYKGRYETVFPLVYREVRNGRLVTEHMPLSSYLIDVIIPIIVLSRDVSLLKRKAVFEDRREREKKEREARIADCLQNAYPALGEVRSAAHLACNSVIQKKVEQISRHWKQAAQFLRTRPKGLSVIG